MFIDASREFEKGKNQNNLTADNIEKKLFKLTKIVKTLINMPT
ncbi:hypothetical protein [Apilactobacillus ozensis]